MSLISAGASLTAQGTSHRTGSVDIDSILRKDRFTLLSSLAPEITSLGLELATSITIQLYKPLDDGRIPVELLVDGEQKALSTSDTVAEALKGTIRIVVGEEPEPPNR